MKLLPLDLIAKKIKIEETELFEKNKYIDNYDSQKEQIYRQLKPNRKHHPFQCYSLKMQCSL